MAMVNVTLDTKTRASYLTIDGVVVATNDFYINKYFDYEGNERVDFGYTIETVGEGGLKEQHRFYLPPLELKGDGTLIVEKVDSFSKAKADVIKFFQSRE